MDTTREQVRDQRTIDARRGSGATPGYEDSAEFGGRLAETTGGRAGRPLPSRHLLGPRPAGPPGRAHPEGRRAGRYGVVVDQREIHSENPIRVRPTEIE